MRVTFALALLMLKVPQTEIAFDWINRAVDAIAAATKAGTSFVFGYVGGGPLPFELKDAGRANSSSASRRCRSCW